MIPIPTTLSDRYRGSGYAIAMIRDGQIIDLRYMRDIIGRDGADDAAINDHRVGAEILLLRAAHPGADVHVGMCSCWEFNKL